MIIRWTDKFTDDAILPFGLPSDVFVLAWIELPDGEILYLDSKRQWHDETDPLLARSINACMAGLKAIHGGRLTDGSPLAYYCSFASAYLNNEYPVRQRILEELGTEHLIY